MNPSKPPTPRSTERRIAPPGQHGLWSPATEALLQACWAEMKIPSAAELLAMPHLFDPAHEHRMAPRYLALLRERVSEGRVQCGDSSIDDFIDDVFSNDLTLESYFVIQDTQMGRLVHPLDRGFMRVTPFQVATELGWSLSIGEDVLPGESSLMHAAGLFIGAGYFRCAHPHRVHLRQGMRATMDEVQRARKLALAAPLKRLCEVLPEDGALLTALLLGWHEAAGARRLAGLNDESLALQEQYARLATRLQISATRLSHLWASHVRWAQPAA